MTNRDQKITRLFESHATRLERVVASKVGATPETVEDACSFAWAQLVAHTDVDPDSASAFAWLVMVAVREVWNLTGRAIPAADVEVETVPAFDTRADLDTIVESHDAREIIAQLPERQRKVKTLQVLGFSYEEIADALGWTYTAVNRHITRANKRIREIRGGE